MSLKDISLTVRAGEILAIAGVAGNGQGELFDIVSGEYTVSTGETISLRGKAVGTQGINARRLLGAGFVPEVLNRSVIDRVIIVTDDEAAASAHDLAEHEGRHFVWRGSPRKLHCRSGTRARKTATSHSSRHRRTLP